MVREESSKYLVIPTIVSVLLLLVFYHFGYKYLLAASVLLVGGFLSLIDIRVAIFSVSFALPFLPNNLALLAFLGLGLLYFARRIFVEKSMSKFDIYSGIIFLFLLMISIQTITSVDFKGSLRDLGLHIGGIVYVYVIANSIDNKKDLNYLLTIILAAVTLVALIGVIQSYTGVEIRREWVDVEANPDLAIRVYSVFGNPNTLAEYLVMFTPLAVGMFWDTKDIKKKIIFGIAVALMLICLVLTMSRGGWVGMAMAAFIFCFFVDKRLLLLAIPLGLIALKILPASVINRILSIGNTTDSSNAYRLEIWENTWKMIRDNKIAGVGLGHIPYREVFGTYSRSILTYHAHNSFLQTLAELGIAGFMIFITSLIAFIKYPIKYLIKNGNTLKKDKYFKYIGVGVIAGIIGVFTHGLVENVLYLPKIIFSFWTLVGIGSISYNISLNEKPIVIKYQGDIYSLYRGKTDV